MRLDIDHPTDRPNFTRVDIGDVTVWFSYSTVIGFRIMGSEPVVSENDWGPTTGKHLNVIDDGDKKSRLPRGQFVAAMDSAFAVFDHLAVIRGQ